MSLPKIPKGLRRSIARLKRKEAKMKAVSDRKALIAKMKKEKEALHKKLYGY